MIDAYRGIAPDSQLAELELLAEPLRGRTLQHVNATRDGGGVAELLANLLPCTESLGIPTSWEVVPGNVAFFEITKAMHNALQGAEVEVPHADLQRYRESLREIAGQLRFDADVVIVHDPQPAYLIETAGVDRARFVWRCHIDLSHPSQPVWRFLRRAVQKYAFAVFHVAHFAQRLPIPQLLMPPSIDPLSDKNRELDDAEVTAVTDRFGIDRRRPILLQVSRFDRFKDPLGVIEAHRMVRQSFDCQLVLAGGSATDDPEGAQVLAEVQEAAARERDVLVLPLPPGSDVEINALQRAATIVLQKSTREGFGLTVTEAMWKGKPVIAGAVGGIPSQVLHGVTGFLVHSPEGAAFRMRLLLTHPRLALRMGRQGQHHVRRHFLITRHARDHLVLMHAVLNPGHSRLIRLPTSQTAVARAQAG
jgi:trehalose synthase